MLVERMGKKVVVQKRKMCISCKIIKSAEDFYNDKTKKSGLSSWCKYCNKKDMAKNYKIIPCACGCGTMIRNKDKKNRETRFVFGHIGRVMDRSYCKKDIKDVNQWHCRRLAREKLLKIEIKECCLKHLGQCKGRVEVHHKDKNIRNNELSNLKLLCKRHHTLIHLGYIDFNSKENPKPYIFPNGMTIYKNNKQYMNMKGL